MVKGKFITASVTSLALVVGTMFSVTTPSYASPTNTSSDSTYSQNLVDEKTVEAISNATFYNVQTKKIELDVEAALAAGADKAATSQMNEMYQSMTEQQVQDFLDLIGYEAPVVEHGPSPRALPAVLIPIASFLGGAVGSVIIGEVMQYGIAKACQNLEGEYDFFTDFCKTRGYI